MGINHCTYNVNSILFAIVFVNVGGTPQFFASSGHCDAVSQISSIIEEAFLMLFCLANSSRSVRVISSNFPFTDIWWVAVHPPLGF